jgi:hypothetical protein
LRERRVSLDFQFGQVTDFSDRQPALPHRLDQVEREQDQENVADQDQAGCAFARMNIGEQSQNPFVGRCLFGPA